MGCYHSEMDSFEHGGREYGIVGCAVGAPYAVLLAGADVRLRLPASGQHHLFRPD
jgi:hypothetical protein